SSGRTGDRVVSRSGRRVAARTPIAVRTAASHHVAEHWAVRHRQFGNPRYGRCRPGRIQRCPFPGNYCAMVVSDCMSMLLVRLLWEPLPDTLPASGGRFPRVRDLAAALTGETTPISEQERVDRRVRRGTLQRVV